MARQDFYDDPNAPAITSLSPSVCAVVVRERELLMIHRLDNDRWAVPGGGVELGESASRAAARELLEDTGVEIDVVGLAGLYTDPRHVMHYDDDGDVHQQFSICFRAEPRGGTLRTQPAETKAVRWVPFDELRELDIHPSMRRRIDHGLRWIVGDPAHFD